MQTIDHQSSTHGQALSSLMEGFRGISFPLAGWRDTHSSAPPKQTSGVFEEFLLAVLAPWQFAHTEMASATFPVPKSPCSKISWARVMTNSRNNTPCLRENFSRICSPLIPSIGSAWGLYRGSKGCLKWHQMLQSSTIWWSWSNMMST